MIELVDTHFKDHFGTTDDFHFAVTAEGAQQALEHFIDFALPCFGDFQDAMSDDEDWLFHSILSPYINCGLLDPMTVCETAAQAWYAGQAPINAVEGFIRQILGWREFVRGIYWHFINRHRENFASNPRMGMMYRNWDKQKPERREALLQRADDLLARLEQL